MSPINLVAPNQELYTLSEEQIDSYHKDGFLLIQDFFSAEEHGTLVAFCQEFQKWPKEKGKWMQYYEINTVTGENQLCRTENFTPFHDGMASYVKSPRLFQVIKELYGEDYNLYKEKINYKLPGGGGFPAHQDFKAFRLGKSSHTTVMFTVDATTNENGCLEVVPGSHNNEFEGRSLPQEADGSIAVDWCKQQQWVPVYCKPGSVLIFGAYLAHRSGDNKTEKPRQAVYLTYNASSEGDFRDEYYDEKRKVFPPSYEREEGKDYSEGAIIYNLATPIRS
ncbi:phytanoyl-CoA dioxygenase [Mucor ambiguus]|uniref:Phytanoyl-CoA dioxygenase n=1 Tax=Mucor ambiguus TaxID=91626 RepID=A0A0C9MJK8_9FUNG|nr:phytanoyl-CoA dioxygenase [Mucor ambiguus]